MVGTYKLHLENNEDFEKLYVAVFQFVLKGIFLETLKEEKICFPEKHSLTKKTEETEETEETEKPRKKNLPKTQSRPKIILSSVYI